MSLIVGITAAEGSVLVTDSLIRDGDVTILTARKRFTLQSQSHVAVAFCGLISLGRRALLPASMLVEALDSQLLAERRERMTVVEFAALLSETLLAMWQASMPEDQPEPTMDLVVAGIDDGERYGELWSFQFPTQPDLRTMASAAWTFAMAYWGQTQGVAAMIEPYDFPFRFMPLESRVELAEFVITGTSQLEGWSSWKQHVGGPVDVVTITRADGARWVRQKPFWRE